MRAAWVRPVACGAVCVLAAVVAILTLLPLSPSNAWWVRAWDFPRVHLLVAAVAVLLAAPLAARPLRGPVALAMIAAAAYQALWAVRYTPLVPPEVALVPGGGATFVALNVLQSNEDKARIRAYLEAADPDVLLLMETDAAWSGALAPFLDRYPHRAERIASDHYGMIVATRLPASRIEVRETRGDGDREAPIAVAVVDLDGVPVVFTGLHPFPPVPQTSRAERDRQTAISARLARGDGVPAVAMGDFNDVAWSRNAQLFRAAGGYLDPRVGRGVMASFHASSWFLRFPIDQGLVTEGITVHGYTLGPDVGSDHLPVEMRLSARGEGRNDGGAAALSR